MGLRPKLFGLLVAPVVRPLVCLRKTLLLVRIKRKMPPILVSHGRNRRRRWDGNPVHFIRGHGRFGRWRAAPELPPTIVPPVNYVSDSFDVTHLITPDSSDNQPKDRHRNPDTVPPAHAFHSHPFPKKLSPAYTLAVFLHYAFIKVTQ